MRTSFVAVERSGQLGFELGLKKENYGDTVAKRRESFSMDEQSTTNVDKTVPINSGPEAGKVIIVTETTPRSEPEMKPTLANSHGVQGEALPALKGDVHKRVLVDERKSKVLRRGTNGDTTATAVTASTTVDEKPKQTKGTTRPAPSATSARPASITTTKNPTIKPTTKPKKSPVLPKTPTTPTKLPTSPGKVSKPIQSRSTVPSNPNITKAMDSKAIKSSAGSSNPVKNATKSDGATSSSATARRTNQVTSNSAFQKPRPKSPTKPVKLPSSMTAPTASSLSKVSPASPPSRQAHRPAQEQNTKVASRPPSRMNLTSNAELRRKSSSLMDRPALGKPPAPYSVRKQSSRQSLPGVPASEGFLARMMRPTTSSASKTYDKAVTPPRSKSSTRPTTRDGPGHHKTLEGYKGSPPTKKHPVVPKAPKVQNTKEEAPHSIKYSEPENSTIVESLAELTIETGDAKPALEENSETKGFSEPRATEDIKPAEEPSALKESLEQPAAIIDDLVNGEAAAPEKNTVVPKPDIPSSPKEPEAIPENGIVAPEAELSIQDTVGPVAEEYKDSEEHTGAEEHKGTEDHKVAEEDKGTEDHKGVEEHKGPSKSEGLDGTDILSEEASAVAQTLLANDSAVD